MHSRAALGLAIAIMLLAGWGTITALAVGWIVGFFLMIMLLGFPPAVAVLVFAYLKVQGKEGWLFSAVFTAVVWGCFYGLFDMLLHLPFPPGWLFTWFA